MSFNEKVWALCRKVPAGKVTTYRDIAQALGTKAYQAVGNALNANPYGAWSTSGAEMVPCHRVVNSDGRIGGFARGTEAKIALLENEGVEVVDGLADMEKYFFKVS
jgi:methylated-DNA-[protein]-cysteine S-methyltransferase